MTILYNPFTNRGMINKENEFVGREREISDILARIRNGNSVSVVVERRIGKSSLLYHLGGGLGKVWEKRMESAENYQSLADLTHLLEDFQPQQAARGIDLFNLNEIIFLINRPG